MVVLSPVLPCEDRIGCRSCERGKIGSSLRHVHSAPSAGSAPRGSRVAGPPLLTPCDGCPYRPKNVPVDPLFAGSVRPRWRLPCGTSSSATSADPSTPTSEVL